MAVNGQVMIEDRHGTSLPYSKGLMATSIMATGVGPEEAYVLSQAIEQEVLKRGGHSIPSPELAELASKVLADWGGDALGQRYLAWRRAIHAERPIIVLVGGATGVGKSTVATRIAARLGFTRVIATDAIREVMRGIFTADLLPAVHASSFEAAATLHVPVPDGSDPTLIGFRQQAEAVALGIRAITERAIREGTSVIVEGVHIVPGLLPDAMARWRESGSVVEVLLVAPDPDAHRAHFRSRQAESQSRRPDRYLEHLAEIRNIQRYLRRLARDHGVAEVHSRSLDETIQDVLDLVVAQVTEAR